MMLFVLLSNLMLGAFAHAKDYVIDRSYYLDESNAKSFQQIEQEAFTPYQHVLTGGFQSGTYWLKLNIRHSDEWLVLRIRPIFTEEIELFDPASVEKKPMIGAKYSWKASEIQGVSHNFLIPPGPRDREVYLRVKSARTYLIFVDALTKQQFQEASYTQQLLFTGYCVFTLLLAAWLLVTWLTNRELVLGLFVVQQFLAFFYTVFQTGLNRPLLEFLVSATAQNDLFSFIVVIYPFFSLLANKFLLEEYGLKRAFSNIFVGLLCASFAVICIHFWVGSIAFKLNNFLVLLMVLFYCVCSIFGTNLTQAGFKAGALSINTLRLFYTFNFVFWVLIILPYLGLMPAGEMTLHSVYFYSILSGMIFIFLLQFRAKTLLKMETERATVLRAEADRERMQREEQSMLMAMLSHEIKTPLSVLKLVVDEKVSGSDLEGHANRAVNNIDFIVQRCLQLGKLDAATLPLARNKIELKPLLMQVVTDHMAGDRVVMDCDDNVSIQTDADLLQIVISNLLENAIKYSPMGSSIYIKAHPMKKYKHDGVQISLINEAGMLGTPDPQQVFKKYYRNASATKVSGSGLGLYLVRELVSVMDGDIQYQLEKMHVVFKVWMPN